MFGLRRIIYRRFNAFHSCFEFQPYICVLFRVIITLILPIVHVVLVNVSRSTRIRYNQNALSHFDIYTETEINKRRYHTRKICHNETTMRLSNNRHYALDIFNVHDSPDKLFSKKVSHHPMRLPTCRFETLAPTGQTSSSSFETKSANSNAVPARRVYSA